MNGRNSVLGFVFLNFVLPASNALAAQPADETKLRALIVDGQNNQNWK
jgi:hypothetical protein